MGFHTIASPSFGTYRRYKIPLLKTHVTFINFLSSHERKRRSKYFYSNIQTYTHIFNYRYINVFRLTPSKTQMLFEEGKITAKLNTGICKQLGK